MRILNLLIGVFVLLLVCSPAGAVLINQVDTFQDGTTMNWAQGSPSSNPPVNIVNGGPLGLGDNYLQTTSSGGSGPGSGMTLFNKIQWSGNYLGAPVTQITADFANFGDSPIFLRLALQGNASQRYGSTSAFTLPTDGQWHSVSFGLTAADLSLISGSDSLNTVLSGVSVLRIISAANGPDWRGDRIIATLGVDNITAIPEPAITTLLVLGGLTVLRKRRG